jgi:hypothetical protein
MESIAVEVEMPYETAPVLAELARRADAGEVLYLTRGGGLPALVVMTEDVLDQAFDVAGLLATARTVTAEMERHPEDTITSGTPEWDTLFGDRARTA